MKEKLHQDLLLFAQKIFNNPNPLTDIKTLKFNLLQLYEAATVLENQQQPTVHFCVKNTESIEENTEDFILVKKENISFEKAPNPITHTPPVTINITKPQEKQSINEAACRGSIGLNDRIAFMAHLFNGSSIAYNQAMQELGAIITYQEVCTYIDTLKTQYNNWVGKEPYEERFRCIFMRKFGVKPQ